MIASLDSSFDAPTLAQARAAKAAGIGFWWGYLATRPNVGLAAPWPELAFSNVLEGGLGCGAFVSGWDDPVALRELAQAWRIPLLALDDEDGIRPLSQPDWRPAFLQALGGGHYGLLGRLTLPAQFRIAALYPPGGCTGATWPTSPAPAGPHGWQCQGTHTEFGLSVDRSALDDWFGGQTMLDPTDGIVQEFRYALRRLTGATFDGQNVNASFDSNGTPTYTHQPNWPFWLAAQFGAEQTAEAQALTAITALQTALGQVQVPAADLQPLKDELDRIEAALRSA